MKNIIESRNNMITAEQVKMLYRQIPTSMVTTYIAIITLTFAYDDSPNNFIIYFMAFLLICITSVHLVQYRRFNSFDLDDKKTIRWGWYFSINSFIAALSWSFFFYFIFDPTNLQSAYFIVFICACYIIGPVPLLSSFLPACFIYASTFSLPLIVYWIMSDNSFFQIAGVFMFAELIVTLSFSYWLNRSSKTSINLQFENMDLVKSLQIQKDAADQANLAKSQFLAAASHDLRQPLHALSLFTEALDDMAQEPKIRRVADQINMSVRVLEKLFDGILDISRLDAGVIKPEKTHIDMSLLLSKLMTEYEPLTRAKGLRLFCQDCPFTVYTDEGLLTQILRNYISNAIRYTEHGEVKITYKPDNTSIVLNVEDTGIGIASNNLDDIFNEFHQLANPGRNGDKGLGLGLAIVRRSAKILDHPINVQSILGKGSTFSITIDRAKGKEKNAAIYCKNNIISTIQNEVLILVIDDDEAICIATKNLLELWGCDVLTATSTLELLAKTRNQNKTVDGIIADYRLQDQHTGIEAIHMIKKEYGKEIPALIITGDVATDRLQEMNKSGIQVLFKPAPSIKLRTFVNHIQLKKQPAFSKGN